MKKLLSNKFKSSLFISLCFSVLFTSCYKDKGSVTMTYYKGAAIYGNVETLRNTPLISSAETIENPGKIFIGEDFILIGEEHKGIHVFDNSNPNSPVNVSFLDIPFSKEFFVEDNVIYAESHYDFLKIDISNIYSPSILFRYENTFGSPLLNNSGEQLLGFDFELVTETLKLNSPELNALNESFNLYYDYSDQLIPASKVPSSFAGSSSQDVGTLNKIAIYDKFIYMIGKSKLLYFEDNQSSFVNVQELLLEDGLETIYLEDDNLFIGSDNSMTIVNVSTPSAPNYVSEYFHSVSCDPVLPFKDVAYLTLRSNDDGCNGTINSLDVIDINNINNPIPLTSIPMSSPYGLRIVNNYLFIGEGINGLTVFDANSPENLVYINNYENIHAYDIMMHPTISDRLLTTNQNGLQQYAIDFTTMEVYHLSTIGY